VQAHTSGEVGILGTVLLRVFSGTAFAIFIEIGLYLTDKEQKISWHSFFETRCSRGETRQVKVFQFNATLCARYVQVPILKNTFNYTSYMQS